MKGKTIKNIVLMWALVCPFASAIALPSDPGVASGAASVNSADKNMTITQSTDKAVINWDNFDIALDENVQFKQPSSSSFTLNRVFGNSKSVIDGGLSANGNIMLINRNGILFGKNAKVDVNKLIATTSDIQDADFLNDKLKFDAPSNLDAAIINEGSLSAKDHGLIGLVAPNVSNSGVITANLGTVQLASGEAFEIDLYGDNLLTFKANEKLTSQLVENSGKITANGGKINITAAAGRDLVNSLIDIKGELTSQSIGERNGSIYIYAEGGNAVENNLVASKGQKQGSSKVDVAAKLDVSGQNAGEVGGEVALLADEVNLVRSASINASGAESGGVVKVGGDFYGQGSTPTSRKTTMDSSALIVADALNNKDGGKVSIWSDAAINFYGSIYARGGKNYGDGGFVETSGHRGNLYGFVDVTATKGKRGNYLIDPTNITISGNVTPASFTGNVLWYDLSNLSSVQLDFWDISSTATGTSGSNAVTTSVDSSQYIFPGSKIGLGTGVGLYDIYTVQSISGTNITTAETLSTNYSGVTFYNSAVAGVNDLSGSGYNVTQNDSFAHGFFYGNGANGNGALIGAGQSWLTSNAGPNVSGAMSLFAVAKPQDNVQVPFGEVAFAVGDGNHQAMDLAVNRTPGVQSVIWGNNEINNGTTQFNTAGHQIFESTRSGSSGNWTSNLYLNGALDHSVSTAVDPDNISSIGLGALSDTALPFKGEISEVVAFNRDITGNERYLLEQYQSGKWNIALNPIGTGATEIDKATASDGYPVFTTRYLERLSNTADVTLLATNNITFDLNGDTLTVAPDRNLTITSTGGGISAASSGTIETSRTVNGGNVTMNAHGAIDLSQLTLNATGGDVTLLSSSGNITLGDVTGRSLFARTSGATSDITLASGSTITTTDHGSSMILASGRNFINSSGSGALSGVNGRWLIYSNNPSNSTLNGLNGNFIRYACVYSGSCPALGSGNGLLYVSNQPRDPNILHSLVDADLKKVIHNIVDVSQINTPSQNHNTAPQADIKNAFVSADKGARAKPFSGLLSIDDDLKEKFKL